ncbi:Periplasmic (NiFeSe) hydrogenase large subunit [Candidatus Magnetomoraceae bacterium gMMP-15]
MAKTINIDPITRIEGHLGVKIEVESDKVINAFVSGEMFRGFEVILKGRHPMDAQQITQRICGVCPVSHGTASILAQEEAYNVRPPKNGRIMRNIVLAANYIQSHILHFYHLSALDFVDITAILNYTGNDSQLQELKSWVKAQVSSNLIYPAAPFLPRYSGKYIEDTEVNILAIKHYLDALDMRALAHKLGAVFGGRLPHAATLVPGGITEKLSAKKIASCISMIKKLQIFIDKSYIPDIIAAAYAFPEYFTIGKGCGNFLAYGVFHESDDHSNKLFSAGVIIDGKLKNFDSEKITEDVKFSRFSQESGLKPINGRTIADPHKNNAYSWIKAPRYNGKVMEVGPLARMMVDYYRGKNPKVKKLINGLLDKISGKPRDLISVLGRHAARAVECKIVADRCLEWIEELNPNRPVFTDFDIPESAEGIGLTEAPRGALGHWLKINDYKISNYQCVVPTTWNCSPRDANDNPGAVELALVGTPIADKNNPIEATRVVRSFDPCIACAVH